MAKFCWLGCFVLILIYCTPQHFTSPLTFLPHFCLLLLLFWSSFSQPIFKSPAQVFLPSHDPSIIWSGRKTFLHEMELGRTWTFMQWSPGHKAKGSKQSNSSILSQTLWPQAGRRREEKNGSTAANWPRVNWKFFFFSVFQMYLFGNLCEAQADLPA